MRFTTVFAVPLALSFCFVANAQKKSATGYAGQNGVVGPGGVVGPYGVGATRWRQTFGGYLGRAPGSLTYRDLQEMESQIALAGQYCVGLTPGDYESNRELVRQMTTYLAGIQVAAGDQRMNLSLRRLTRSLAAFPCAYGVVPGQQPPPGAAAAPPPPPPPGEPPFTMSAPVLSNVPKADQDTAKDLRERYAMDASHAATAWKNADQIRRNLSVRGQSLNAQTSAAVDRLKILLDEAADALRDHKWDDALSSLQGVEATTQKVNSTVGN
jgi:hypothetical protein